MLEMHLIILYYLNYIFIFSPFFIIGKGKVTRTGNATIDINIRHAPGKTYILPEQPVAVDGKPITLTCGATPSGYPVPTFKWWKENSDR